MEFNILATKGSRKDQSVVVPTANVMARKCLNTSLLARSTIAFSSFESEKIAAIAARLNKEVDGVYAYVRAEFAPDLDVSRPFIQFAKAAYNIPDFCSVQEFVKRWAEGDPIFGDEVSGAVSVPREGRVAQVVPTPAPSERDVESWPVREAPRGSPVRQIAPGPGEVRSSEPSYTSASASTGLTSSSTMVIQTEDAVYLKEWEKRS